MNLLQDLRYGVRMLARNPGFTGVVVLALALGIGANTAVFTMVNAVLFKGLPFERADRVMYLASNNLPRGREDIGSSYPDVQDWRAQNKSFQGLAAFAGVPINISDGVGTPERYSGVRVTSNLFSLIGQKPLIGRDFLPTDDQPGAPEVAIIGFSIWQNRYGSDPKVLGRTIRINQVPTTIIGVMPNGMKFPVNHEVWLALIPTAELQRRDNHALNAFGRLKDDVTLAGARAEMDLLGRQLAKSYPKTNDGIGVVVKPYNDEYNGGNVRRIFLVLLGAVGFVLLIACANVANLLLSRSIARTKEVSVRSALGAGRWRIVRQLLVESVLLGLLGGLAGLGLAVTGVRLFSNAVANVGKPYWIDFSMDYTVFAYLAGVCVVTGILFGLAPALQLSKLDISEALKEGARGATGSGRTKYLSGILVVGEVSLAVVLLAGAGLMIRSFLKIYGMHGNIDAEKLLTMRLNLADAKYPTADARLAFQQKLLAGLQAAPGVESVALTSNVPLGGAAGWRFEKEGDAPVESDKRPSVSGLVITSDYFRVLGLPVVRGRAFEDSDGMPGRNVVIANQRFVEKYWPGEDPLGKRLRLVRDTEQPWLTVVGVCPYIRQNDPTRPVEEPILYLPYRQDPLRGVNVLARARVAPLSLSSAFRKEVQALDQDLPTFGVMTLYEFFIQARWPFRVFGIIFTIFALIALLLSSVGIYGVMAYSVSRRTQEIGVRIALGASTRNILLLVLRRGLIQLGIGMAAGLAAAFGVTRLLSALLVQVKPTDPLTFTIVFVVLTAVGLLACWIPSRRAMKVDPVVALRYE